MMAAVTPTGATGAAGVALRVQAMDMRREEPGHSTAISSFAHCIPGFRTSAGKMICTRPLKPLFSLLEGVCGRARV